MPDIVLTTLNARYWHSAFGLRYLMANMGELQSRSIMLEFGVNDRIVDVLSSIVSQQPGIVGVGVYIWNVNQATQLVQDLKRIHPEICVVIGGPEVSYETDGQAIVEAADYVITGEADLAFPELCRNLLNGRPPSHRIIQAPTPALSEVCPPYHLYNDEDVSNRVIYVEISRGCPFTCEFCLSALDIPVRLFDLDEFLAAMQSLLDRGARQFKFVDRTFNLNIRVSRAVLRFFLERYEPGLFLHFELIPDRMPASLCELIQEFPDGALQFEIGVQTFNDEVGVLISRAQDNAALERNFRFLRAETGVHIHADLIIGLPGETVESFAAGFDRLVALDPQEIQLGILKRLRGTPITRHDKEWNMVYSSHAPYEILCNRLVDFEVMHELRRFSRFWDLISNSGNFRRSRDLIWKGRPSAFDGFMEFARWMYAAEDRSHGIPLAKLAERLFEFVTGVRGLPSDEVAECIWTDYCHGGRTDKPAFLRSFELKPPHEVLANRSALPARQARHIS